MISIGYLCGVAVLTMTPQRTWDGPVGLVRVGIAHLHDQGVAPGVGFIGVQTIANVLMFVPIGAFAAAALGVRWWWLATVCCIVLTVAIESTQRGIPGRVSGERDLIANAVGGLLGVLLVVAVRHLPDVMRIARPAPLADSKLTPAHGTLDGCSTVTRS